MDSRIASFLLFSALAHGALIGWQGSAPGHQPPRIGGQAEALRVSLLPVSRSDLHSTPPTATRPAAQSRAPQRPVAADVEAQPRAVRGRSPQPAPPPSATATANPQHAGGPSNVQQADQPPADQTARHDDAQQLGQRVSAALQQELAKQFEYPWLARKRGWQGQVMLSLHIHENGDLTDWAISETSGHKLLDHSALECARRIDRLPEAARWLEGRSLQLRIPVQYRLRDS